MFAKDKVPQSLVDAVNKILATESKKSEPEQLNEAFPTVADAKKRMNEPKPSGGAGIKLGTRYGGGRQADEPEKDEDEPKKREKYGARKTRFTNTKLYKEEEKWEGSKKDKEEDKKLAKKHGMTLSQWEKSDADKKHDMEEELKGKQHKIDANKNGKIDSQDFEILRSKKKKMTEGLAFAEHLIESMYGKKSALPLDEKEMSDAQKKKREDIVMSMKKDTAGLKKRYGSRWKDVMYATATKQAMKQETYGEEVEIDEAKKPMTQDEKDRVTAGLRAAMKKSYDNEMKGRAALETAKAVAKAMASAHKAKKTNEEVEIEEEIDPNVRTKDALSGGNKPTKQKDDTGPGSDGRSTKVKFRGGPMDEEKENEKEDEGHEDEKEDKALVKKLVKKDALKEDEQLDEISKKTVKSYLSKTVDPVYGIPKSKEKLSQRMKGISAAHQRVVGNKPTSEEVEQIDEKKGYGESDPLANRADYAKRHGTGQVYKKTHPGNKTGMTQAYAYNIKRSGPKGKLPEEVEQIDELSHGTLRSYVDKAKAENLPGKGGNRGVALLTPGTRDKGVHKAVDKMKKMKANEEVELDETSHMNKPKSLKSFMAMKKEMIGKAGMTSEKKDED